MIHLTLQLLVCLSFILIFVYFNPSLFLFINFCIFYFHIITLYSQHIFLHNLFPLYCSINLLSSILTRSLDSFFAPLQAAYFSCTINHCLFYPFSHLSNITDFILFHYLTLINPSISPFLLLFLHLFTLNSSNSIYLPLLYHPYTHYPIFMQ